MFVFIDGSPTERQDKSSVVESFFSIFFRVKLLGRKSCGLVPVETDFSFLPKGSRDSSDPIQVLCDRQGQSVALSAKKAAYVVDFGDLEAQETQEPFQG